MEDLELIFKVLVVASSASGEAISLIGDGNVDATLVLHVGQ